LNDWLDKLPFAPAKPRHGAKGGSWIEEAKGYLAHPGKWRRLHTFTGEKARQQASNLVSGIHRKDLKAFRTTGHWETARREVSDTEVEVWVRWMDTNEPAPASVVSRVTRSPRKKG
jgi:hypothetical protein